MDKGQHINDENRTPEEAKSEQDFPKGIEGVRGEKDSAWRARQWYLEQRGLTSEQDEWIDRRGESDLRQADQQERTNEMAKAQNPQQAQAETTEFEVQAGSLGETFDDAEISALLAPEPPLAMAGDLIVQQEALGVSGGMSIDIASVRTSSQSGTQTVFLRNTDALTLVMHLVASQQLVASGRKFNANYQIIEFATNTVKRNQWSNGIGFSWGTHFWISQGNNWGPTANDYTTPARWGLNTGLYIYRATVEVQGIGAFSFSQEHTFRVR